LFLGKTPV